MRGDAGRCGEISEPSRLMGCARCGEIMGRCGEISHQKASVPMLPVGMARFRIVQGLSLILWGARDMGEMWGDVERCGET